MYDLFPSSFVPSASPPNPQPRRRDAIHGVRGTTSFVLMPIGINPPSPEGEGLGGRRVAAPTTGFRAMRASPLRRPRPFLFPVPSPAIPIAYSLFPIAFARLIFMARLTNAGRSQGYGLLPRSGGDTIRWFEQAISKHKVPSNAISPPCDAEARTVQVISICFHPHPFGVRILISTMSEVNKMDAGSRCDTGAGPLRCVTAFILRR